MWERGEFQSLTADGPDCSGGVGVAGWGCAVGSGGSQAGGGGGGVDMELVFVAENYGLGG